MKANVSDEFKVGDKVMYSTIIDGNPFGIMRGAHGVEYCIIRNITPHKYRAGGIGYSLIHPVTGKFLITVSAKALTHYI